MERRTGEWDMGTNAHDFGTNESSLSERGGAGHMSVDEERAQLAKRVEKGVLGVFVNDRAVFLDLLDEKSVLVSAGSKVFKGRSAYESWPLNPPGISAKNVTFAPLYTNQPDEAIVVGTYLLSGPCIHGTVNQRVTVNLRWEGDDWKISLAHFSNEWPSMWPQSGVSDGRSASDALSPRRLQLRSEDGIVFVDPEEIVYAESAGKHCIVHLRDRKVTASVLLRGLCEMLPDQFVRTNRFYVVNVRYVQGVGRDGILFATGEQIPIPERRVKEIQLEIASAVTRNFS